MLNENPIKISPSILSANFAFLQEEIDKISNADYLHIDIMDGHFVPIISFGTVIMKCIKSGLVKDVHLMVENPFNYIEEFAKAGANIITFHYEACKNISETIDKIHSFGVKAGISLNPNSKIEDIIDFIPKLDMVLIMTVYPGLSGQKFMPEVLDKVKRLREMFPKIDIEVDGGINEETARAAIENGANVLVSASYIFNSESPSEKIEILRKIT